MTKEELTNKLQDLVKQNKSLEGDKEYDHQQADRLLLEYINDPEVSKLFNDLDKWYA